MAQYILIVGLLIQIAAYGGASEKESNLLPLGSHAKVCSQALTQLVTPKIAQGDMMIVREDVSHLLHDPKIPAYDIQSLSSPYNYFQAHFSNPDAVQLLTQQSRIHGPKNDRMEYIYLVQAKKPGKTDFTYLLRGNRPARNGNARDWRRPTNG